MKFIVKKQVQDNKLVLNIIDIELKGRVLEEGSKIINLSSEYYSGEEMDEKEIKDLIERAYSIQFIGNNSVEYGIRNKLIIEFDLIDNIKYGFLFQTTC